MVERPDELESALIQQDIERTRQRMSGTIDEIQERLTPSRILHKATSAVREAGADSMRRVLSEAGRTAGRTAGQARSASAAAAGLARSHPLSAAMALSGLALVLGRAFMGRRRGATGEPGMNGSELNGWDGGAGSLASANGRYLRQEFDDWAEPSSTARRATAAVTSWIVRNPLAVGAAVAAAGTVVGLSRANRRESSETDTVRR